MTLVCSLASGWTSHVRPGGRRHDCSLEAGVLASVTSLRFSIVSGGVLRVVGCIAAALALPGFLNYDSRESEPHT